MAPTPSLAGLQIETTAFPPSVKPPGSSNTLFLGGAGVRGLEIQGNFVKFTAIRVYLEDNAVPQLAVKWKGKTAEELTESVELFRDIVTGPFEKFIQVTTILPLTGQQYAEKVSENCVAFWKSVGIYTDVEEKAIEKFLEVFKDQNFPPGASKIPKTMPPFPIFSILTSSPTSAPCMLLSPSPSALELSLKSLDRRISQYVAANHPIWSYSADSAAFLDWIDDIIATIRDWTPMADDQSVGVCLARAEDLMQQAMFRLENEFRSLVERGGESRKLNRAFRGESNGALSFDSGDDEEEGEEEVIGDGEEHQIPTAQPIGDYDIVIDALPSGTINDLHEIAKRMVAAGFGKECSHVYSSCRREFLEESMSRLGLQKLSIEEVQKTPWQDLEDEIERWIKSAKVALRILFPSERRLCDRIFYGLSSAADLSFMEVCRRSTIQILNFADAVAIGSRSPERLFRILDVFETLRDLMPEFELVFSDQYCLFLRNEANTIWKRLGEAIRGIFMELENLISRDPPKTPVPGGGLHPITRYVMNYLRAACRSRQTLEQVFEDSAAVSHQPKVDDRASSSPMSVQMAWIMELLESNLETKSKIYGDSALCCVFMMNNGRYIMQKVKDSELGSLLGDDWIRKHTAKIRQYLVNYQRSSWNKVLGVLKPESGSLSPSAAVKSMKEKLKLFNIYFDEICKTQSNWVVFDDQLRDDLRISLVKILLPAYQSFIGRFQNVPEIGRHEKYIKYASEDIHAKINGLFRGGRGSAGAGGGRK